MAPCVQTLGFFLLLGLVTSSRANKDACDLYGAVGQSVTLPFVYERLENKDELRWIHSNTIVFKRHNGTVTVGKAEDVSTTGSLLLKSLKSSNAGLYQVEVFHPNGTLAKAWAAHLCLMDKVTKPHLSYLCDIKSSLATLKCHVAKPQGVTFSWTLDERPLSETRAVFVISLSLVKEWGTFTCSAANKVSKEKSEAVRLTCKNPPLAPPPPPLPVPPPLSPPPPPPQLCFNPKVVVVVLAGGVSVILLLLLIIIITLCCCYRRNKNAKSKGKGQLRMLSLTPRSPDPISSDYETMHVTQSSPPPSPTSSPGPTYQNVSAPESQTENRAAHLATPGEGQRPSPVPKPRTKIPLTPDA